MLIEKLCSNCKTVQYDERTKLNFSWRFVRWIDNSARVMDECGIKHDINNDW